MIFRIFGASVLLVPLTPASPAFWVMPRPKSQKLDSVGAVSPQSPCKGETKRGVSRTLGLGGHLPEENSWANASDISNKGKPTVMNLTMRSKGSSRRSPLRWGPLRSGNRASDSMYSAAACASDIFPGTFGVQSWQEGSQDSGVGRWQLQAAGFEQTVPAAAASRRSVLGAGTGSLNNRPGPEPGIW